LNKNIDKLNNDLRKEEYENKIVNKPQQMKSQQEFKQRGKRGLIDEYNE
jgi:succinyl-CoA synthetase beta subunit